MLVRPTEKVSRKRATSGKNESGALLDRVRILAVYGRVRELSECIKYILICVPKMNEGLTGLERHEGE